MRSRLNVLLALFILAATAAMSMPPVSAQDESSSAGMIDQPVLKIMQAQDAGIQMKGQQRSESGTPSLRISTINGRYGMPQCMEMARTSRSERP